MKLKARDKNVYLKIKKWEFSAEIVPIIDNPMWLHRWMFRFCFFDFYSNDLMGAIIFCNLRLRWEKMFK